MTYVYIVTRALTFFGSILRVFWEHVACRILKLPVEDIRGFKTDETCGHIEHELPTSLSSAFFICCLPFTMNFIFGCAFSLSGAYRLFYVGEKDYWPVYVMIWLGISCFANCASSFEDALAFKDALATSDKKVARILVAPFFAVNYAMSFLERYSVTFVLAILFTVFFPQIFNLLFPLLDNIRQIMAK